MNLESQVVNLELSKKLKALGIEQNSLFYWYEKSEKWGICYTRGKIIDNNSYSAFTVSELLDMLPHIITVKSLAPFDSFRINLYKSFIVDGDHFTPECIKPIYIVNYECDSTECTGEKAWLKRKLLKSISDQNTANCLAKCLIELIENNYFKV